MILAFKTKNCAKRSLTLGAPLRPGFMFFGAPHSIPNLKIGPYLTKLLETSGGFALKYLKASSDPINTIFAF